MWSICAIVDSDAQSDSTTTTFNFWQPSSDDDEHIVVVDGTHARNAEPESNEPMGGLFTLYMCQVRESVFLARLARVEDPRID